MQFIRKYYWVLILLIISGLVDNCGKGDDLVNLRGIRDVKWGMTKEQVKKAEYSSRLTNEDSVSLEYDIMVNDRGCILSYIFRNNECDVAFYKFSGLSPEDKIDLANEIKSILIQKYGNPIAPDDFEFKYLRGLAKSLLYSDFWFVDKTFVILINSPEPGSDLLVNYLYVDPEFLKNRENVDNF